MAALLDVNTLIALLDSDHVFHGRAIGWFTAHGDGGWASCPITENGCIRVMSHPRYPNPLTVSAVIERLAEASRSAVHEFWPDDFSLLDSAISNPGRILGPGQITDVYLLALAVRHRGLFVTFDARVHAGAVHGAEESSMFSRRLSRSGDAAAGTEWMSRLTEESVEIDLHT